MSKFVDELVKDLDENPTSYTFGECPISGVIYGGNGALKKDNVVICNFGNGLLTSIVDVYVNGQELTIPSGRYKLERAVSRWFKRISIEHLKK